LPDKYLNGSSVVCDGTMAAAVSSSKRLSPTLDLDADGSVPASPLQDQQLYDCFELQIVFFVFAHAVVL
jgi:hypothetical protein